MGLSQLWSVSGRQYETDSCADTPLRVPLTALSSSVGTVLEPEMLAMVSISAAKRQHY